MNSLRNRMNQRLREIGVEERVWRGRDDGFLSLLFRGKEFAHFHTDCEIDIRLGKDVIRREGLVHPSDSKVHSGRSENSPWYEMKVSCASDVEEALRLVQIAIQAMQDKK